MAKEIDIAIAANGTPVIVNGDFVYADMSEQHVYNVIAASKGSYIRTPQLGVGLVNFILDSVDSTEVLHTINEELDRDGFTIERLEVDRNFKLNANGKY